MKVSQHDRNLFGWFCRENHEEAKLSFGVLFFWNHQPTGLQGDLKSSLDRLALPSPAFVLVPVLAVQCRVTSCPGQVPGTPSEWWLNNRGPKWHPSRLKAALLCLKRSHKEAGHLRERPGSIAGFLSETAQRVHQKASNSAREAVQSIFDAGNAPIIPMKKLKQTKPA